MGRLLKVTAILVFAMGTLHCANKKNYGTKAAPSSEKQLGLIVKTDEEGLGRLLNNNPEASVRTLNSKNGIYEVGNVSAAEAQSISASPVYKNKFIQGLKKSETQKLSLKNLVKNTSDDANAALATCLESPQQPELIVDISFDPNTFTINLGQEVTITASGTANETVGGEVRFLWDILPPGFSKQAFSIGITTAQKFTPDSVGLYQVAVIAQGADLSCNVQVIPILVTSNPEITSDATTLPRPDDLSLFTHLSYINAEDAWEKSTGKDITVAVLDTGVNYNHKGIRSNISVNKTETLDDNDDDNNGFADDNIGWDFVSNDRFPFDDEGHGSHVSGLVASPVLGVAPDAKIIPVKVLNAAGGSDLATVVAGIYYAVDSGADIINASLGFESLTEVPLPLLEAIEYARSKNVIFLAASGNGGQSGIGFDIKAQPTYPATFNLDNMINVAATALNQITSYSNFSEELVHVAAPGGNENEFVFSLATQNPANSFLAGQAGTSMACPVTAGVVALMLSSDKTGLSPARIREILMETGNELATLKGKTVSGKQVNALKAVQAVLDLQPASSLL